MTEKYLLEQASAADAYERAGVNPLRRYPSPKKDGDRLYPLASPSAKPSFQIEKDDSIFTIGSCFARNVEAALENSGMDVPSREMDLGPIGDSLGQATNFFNKYSIHSIYNELKWALEPSSFPGKKLIYPLKGKGKYADLQLGMAKLEFSIEQIMTFRSRYLEVMARVATADVIIITLGYVETWYDNGLDIYLNIAPPPPLVKAFPGRFEFRVLSYQDILKGLFDIYELLKSHREKPMKMLLTVSPVPLLSTFRDGDVLVANTYSKAVQRAAIEEFIRDVSGVDYFPSYEFVTLSNPTIAWSRGDYRHVSPDLVARIMANVISCYIGEDDPGAEDTDHVQMTPEALLSSTRMMYKLSDFEGVKKLALQHETAFETVSELMAMLGNSHVKLGQIETAFDIFEGLVRQDPKRPQPLERLITLCRPLKRKDRAAELLDRHERLFEKRSQFRENISWN